MFEQIFQKLFKKNFYSTKQEEIRKRIPIFVDRLLNHPYKYRQLLEMFDTCFNLEISKGESKSIQEMSGLLMGFLAIFRLNKNREDLISYLNNLLDLLILDDKYDLYQHGSQVEEFIE